MPTKRQGLVKKLDKIFSIYIRLRNTDESGYAECFTCGVTKFWKEVDAGHFQSRGKLATRWNERNVQFQCKRCNGFRGGEQYLFAQALDRLYGDGVADDLVAMSNESGKFSQYELEDMIETFSKKVYALKQERGI